MLYLSYIVKILFYCVIVWFSYALAKGDYRRGYRLSWFTILVCSALYGCYSVIMTHPVITGDRANYYLRFSDPGWDVSQSESSGLNWVYECLRPISLEANFLFFAMEFAYIFVTFTACRYYKQCSSAKVLLLLLISYYPIYGFTVFKQSLAQALFSVSLMFIFNMYAAGQIRKKFYLLGAALFAYLGCLFHFATIAVVGVLLLLFLWEYKWIRSIGMVLMLAFLFILPYIQTTIFQGIADISDSMNEEMESYLEGGDGFGTSFLVMFKGVPFLIIACVGHRWRKMVYRDIPGFDKSMLVVILCAVLYICSIYNYWYYRYTLYFYLPVFVFAYNLQKSLRQRGIGCTWYAWVYYVTLALMFKELYQYSFWYEA